MPQHSNHPLIHYVCSSQVSQEPSTDLTHVPCAGNPDELILPPFYCPICLAPWFFSHAFLSWSSGKCANFHHGVRGTHLIQPPPLLSSAFPPLSATWEVKNGGVSSTAQNSRTASCKHDSGTVLGAEFQPEGN